MVQVTVSEGVLAGEIINNKFGASFYSFKGIPYAEPPVGELRFKAPRPPKVWNRVRNATTLGSMCYQQATNREIPSHGSEDCLYLNVYTPEINPKTPLPVMFWIHGGAFARGSGEDDVFGPEFLLKHNVLLVTFNYRLEVLGFLCLDSKDIPGNAGLKDQVAALRWVNKNIKNFGGDSENITIFGESAGAVSACYHLVSPMTKGLFKRVIAQSGVSTTWWAHAYRPRDRALALARKLGCSSEDDTEIYAFFKSQPIEALVGIQVPITLAERVTEFNGLHFCIVSEKVFDGVETYFSGNIYDVLSNGVHEGVEVIAGYNADEGILFTAVPGKLEAFVNYANTLNELFVPRPLNCILTLGQQLDVGKQMKHFYFQNAEVTKDSWEQLAKYRSMEAFVYAIIQWAKFYAKQKNNVYVYKFTCKSDRNIIAHLRGITSIIKGRQVVCHADELAYIFNQKCMTGKLDINSKTYQMIDNVTRLWTNFAKYGNPTPGDTLGAKWRPYTLEAQDYLNIGEELVADKEPEKEEIDFWEVIFRNYSPDLAAKL